MPEGPHFHHFHKVLKTVIHETEVPSGDTSGMRHRETATVYEMCDCGCINKTEYLVTHCDGRQW